MKQFDATKHFFLSLLIAGCALQANAKAGIDKKAFSVVQLLSRDTVPPGYETLLNFNDPNDSVIENRLVQLALGQPQYTQSLSQQRILDYQLKKQRNNWLNLLSLSTTYNDQSFSKTNRIENTAYVYPKYFLGVTVPIGLIISNGTDIKITKESSLIAKQQQAELAKSIKATVLSNYRQYKANVKLIAIQNQMVDDQQASLLQAEQKFREGTATLEAYNDASKKYNDEVVKVIGLQLQQDLIKIELERIIGRKLEDALK